MLNCHKYIKDFTKLSFLKKIQKVKELENSIHLNNLVLTKLYTFSLLKKNYKKDLHKRRWRLVDCFKQSQFSTLKILILRNLISEISKERTTTWLNWQRENNSRRNFEEYKSDVSLNTDQLSSWDKTLKSTMINICSLEHKFHHKEVWINEKEN